MASKRSLKYTSHDELDAVLGGTHNSAVSSQLSRRSSTQPHTRRTEPQASLALPEHQSELAAIRARVLSSEGVDDMVGSGRAEGPGGRQRKKRSGSN